VKSLHQVKRLSSYERKCTVSCFARTRVSYQCDALVVSPDNHSYNKLLDAMQERHGKMIGLLRTLPDFVLFRLQPKTGQFVMGFGQAFHLHGDKLDEFEHATSA